MTRLERAGSETIQRQEKRLSVTIVMHKAICLSKLGRSEEALELFDRALAIAEDPEQGDSLAGWENELAKILESKAILLSRGG